MSLTIEELYKTAEKNFQSYLDEMTNEDFKEMIKDFNHDEEYCDKTEDCGCYEDIYIYVLFKLDTAEFVHMYEPMGSQYFSGYPQSEETALAFGFDPDTYDTLEYFKESIMSELKDADYMWAQ